jgi:hypothetical protein
MKCLHDSVRFIGTDLLSISETKRSIFMVYLLRFLTRFLIELSFSIMWSSCMVIMLFCIFCSLTFSAIVALRSPNTAAFAWSPAGGNGKPPGMLFHSWVMQDWWCSILKCAGLVYLGSIMSLVANTWPTLTPHAQRMKLLMWSAAVVVYSLSFSCSVSDSMAAALTIGMSLEGSLVPAFMIVSTSQGAAKKYAEPGYVTAPDLLGVRMSDCNLQGIEHANAKVRGTNRLAIRSLDD